MNHPYLFLSTAVAPIGSGRGGGVEVAIQTLAKGFALRGHRIRILAPAGSRLSDPLQAWNREHGDPITLTTVDGSLQVAAQHHPDRSREQAERQLASIDHLPETSADASALEKMLAIAWKEQDHVYRIVNFAYDRMPLRLTSRFTTPIHHLISMGSLDREFDDELLRTEEQVPGRLACHTHTQAATFPDPVRRAMQIVGLGLDLDRYRFRATPGSGLLWLGRIAPEKGVHEAIEAAGQAGMPLRLAGPVDDPVYWETLCSQWPDLSERWLGFLSMEELQRVTGESKAVLMTPKWEEAFGIVAIEALACGTPVLAYRRGGPSEIIRDGETGYLVPPDRPDLLAGAIQTIDGLSRDACRADAEDRWSMQAWSHRCETWLEHRRPNP
ncbi:MAG: glycosyltransferase [Balneolaceae bacterium]